MRLSDLLEGCDLETSVSGLSDDSSRVCAGDLFVALAGLKHHGLQYAVQAERAGATAIAYDPREGSPPAGLRIPAIAVPELTARLGQIAARFYGSPSIEMEVIGITGTNGKTSCSVYLAQALSGGVIGTLGWGRWPDLEPTAHTTAPVIETQRRLHSLHSLGVETVAMEVTSHALDQGRVDGIAFDLAVWTNLSRDHLDYHGTMESYAAVKRRLVVRPGLKGVVVNLDDPAWPAFTAGVQVPLLGFGWQQPPGADFPSLFAREVRFEPGFIKFTACFEGRETGLRVPLLGESNLANVLAVMATLLARGDSLEEAASRVGNLSQVPGRMEGFRHPGRPLVVVDYAHTPAALEMALRSLRRHTRGKLWVVFGCGGERDRGKRPQMGKVAERLADRIILSDDNPRHEDPDRIIEEVIAGMRKRPRVVRERAQAIATAVTSAEANDIVLVAGKGHENFQEIAGEKRPSSDRALVASLLGEVTSCA